MFVHIEMYIKLLKMSSVEVGRSAFPLGVEWPLMASLLPLSDDIQDLSLHHPITRTLSLYYIYIEICSPVIINTRLRNLSHANINNTLLAVSRSHFIYK